MQKLAEMWPGQEVIRWEAMTSGWDFTRSGSHEPYIEPEGDSPRDSWPYSGQPWEVLGLRTADLKKDRPAHQLELEGGSPATAALPP